MKQFLFSLLFVLLLIFCTQERFKSPESVYFLSNQNYDNLEKNILELIEEAKTEISLAIFSLSDIAVIQALNQKAREGLRVSILVDAKNAWNLKKKLNSKIVLHKKKSKGLMHLKFCILDQRAVWLGSSNLSRESLCMHDNLVLVVCQEGFAQFFQKYFEELVAELKKEPSKKNASTHHQQKTYQNKTLAISVLKLPAKKAADAMIQEMIGGAKKTLDLAIFTFSKIEYAKALSEAQKRGVRVRVFMDEKAAKGAGKAVLQYLEENHVPCYLSTGPQLLHHKFLYIDKEKLLMGSANWTNAAITKNDDCLLRFDQLTNEQRLVLEKICQNLEKECKMP